MKNIVAFLALSIILYSCKSGGTGSPRGTVESFIAAAKTGNLEEVKKYISKSDVSMLEIGQSFLAKLDPERAKEMKDKMTEKFKEKTKDAQIDIKDEKINGDNATVTVVFVHDGQTEEKPFSLVEEEGQWKISLISTGMNNSGASQEEKDKVMQNLNMDSIQGSIGKGIEEFNRMDKDSLKKVIRDVMKEVNSDSLKKAMEEGLKELDKLKHLPKKN